jgi:hypothetical protein
VGGDYAAFQKPHAVFVAPVKVNCTHDCFKSIAADVTVMSALVSACTHKFVKTYLLRHFVQGVALHKLAARGG